MTHILYSVEGSKKDYFLEFPLVINITRQSTSNGVRTWTGDAMIGGKFHRAISYGEQPDRWTCLFHVSLECHKLEQIRQFLVPLAYDAEEPMSGQLIHILHYIEGFENHAKPGNP
jgi:hypothetical protein